MKLKVIVFLLACSFLFNVSNIKVDARGVTNNDNLSKERTTGTTYLADGYTYSCHVENDSLFTILTAQSYIATHTIKDSSGQIVFKLVQETEWDIDHGHSISFISAENTSYAYNSYTSTPGSDSTSTGSNYVKYKKYYTVKNPSGKIIAAGNFFTKATYNGVFTHGLE